MKLPICLFLALCLAPISLLFATDLDGIHYGNTEEDPVKDYLSISFKDSILTVSYSKDGNIIDDKVDTIRTNESRIITVENLTTHFSDTIKSVNKRNIHFHLAKIPKNSKIKKGQNSSTHQSLTINRIAQTNHLPSPNKKGIHANMHFENSTENSCWENIPYSNSTLQIKIEDDDGVQNHRIFGNDNLSITANRSTTPATYVGIRPKFEQGKNWYFHPIGIPILLFALTLFLLVNKRFESIQKRIELFTPNTKNKLTRQKNYPSKKAITILVSSSYFDFAKSLKRLKDDPKLLSFFSTLQSVVSKNFMHKDFTISKLSEQINLSEKTINGRIKAGTLGKFTFRDVLYSIRMKKAEKMLTDSSLEIGKVAKAVGYSPTKFSPAFKKWTGQSPRNFRKTHQLH